jgi:hypothetical protein
VGGGAALGENGTSSDFATPRSRALRTTKEVWDAAFARRRSLKNTSSGRQPTTHLFSGLLRCGKCGGGMAVMSMKVKNGKWYVACGCTVSRTKGDAICGNRAFVSELQLLAFVRV